MLTHLLQHNPVTIQNKCLKMWKRVVKHFPQHEEREKTVNWISQSEEKLSKVLDEIGMLIAPRSTDVSVNRKTASKRLHGSKNDNKISRNISDKVSHVEGHGACTPWTTTRWSRQNPEEKEEKEKQDCGLCGVNVTCVFQPPVILLSSVPWCLPYKPQCFISHFGYHLDVINPALNHKRTVDPVVILNDTIAIAMACNYNGDN